MTTTTAVIDVRTPSETALGMLEGAIEIDLSSALFGSEIAQLDRDVSYVVYCRSGYRSGIAVDEMKALGFANPINGGSIDDAAELTGLPIITR
jgi:rhodanese-related sulfurtransferase